MPVPVDRTARKKIAGDSGGTFHAVASAADVDQAYTQLGRQIRYTTQPEDISRWIVLTGVLVALIGARPSLAWTTRLV